MTRRLERSEPDVAATGRDGGRAREVSPVEGIPTWEEVAREHGNLMYTVAYRLSGDHDQAQDVVQAALVRVRRGLESYKPGNLEGWLSRITTNVFLDEARRRKRRPVQALPDDPDRVLAGSPGADEVLDASGLPAYVQDALRQLPYDFRAAIVLCDVVGMSYPEISDSLSVPVGTVRSRIHRARAAMRDMLRPHLESDHLDEIDESDEDARGGEKGGGRG